MPAVSAIEIQFIANLIVDPVMGVTVITNPDSEIIILRFPNLAAAHGVLNRHLRKILAINDVAGLFEIIGYGRPASYQLMA